MMSRLAGIDLGSNSFHLLIVDINADGKRTSVFTQKQKVQLRAGLDAKGNLLHSAMQTALDCLKNFADALIKYRADKVTVKGTYTLRTIRNRAEFLKWAETTLHHKIDILSGEDEARLIYLGATYDDPIRGKHLVVDIGGGSSEIILGENRKILALASLEMGCVSFQNQYFNEGKLNTENFKHAIQAACDLLSPVAEQFTTLGWQDALGSAGTIRSVCDILDAREKQTIPLTLDFLHQLREQLITIGQVDAIHLPGLREDRENILPGGLSVLIAIFETLNIEKMVRAAGGIREGMIIELL